MARAASTYSWPFNRRISARNRRAVVGQLKMVKTRMMPQRVAPNRATITTIRAVVTKIILTLIEGPCSRSMISLEK